MIWPGGKTTPDALRPHGVDEHYAPLALYSPDLTEAAGRFKDFRWRFQPIADPVTVFPESGQFLGDPAGLRGTIIERVTKQLTARS